MKQRRRCLAAQEAQSVASGTVSLVVRLNALGCPTLCQGLSTFAMTADRGLDADATTA
jgi:hypothetical protein